VSDAIAARPLVHAQPGARAAVDVGVGDTVVVAVLWMPDVRQAVPLAAALQPEPVDVVVAVHQAGGGVVGAARPHAARLVADVQDVVLGRGPPGQVRLRLVQGEVGREHGAAPDQRRGPSRALVGQQVERAELVVVAPDSQEDPGGASGRTGSSR
jgi:hypothetical protein